MTSRINTSIEGNRIVKSHKLIIFNYSMDLSDPIFSHQSEIALKLSDFFEQIEIVTCKLGQLSKPNNVNITVVKWREGRNLLNAYNFYRKFIPLIFRSKNAVLFSHMTEVQSFLSFPLTKILKIDHYLWYAHATESRYLRVLDGKLTGIISSTPGSCPAKKNKKFIIGQSINPKMFKFYPRQSFLFNKFLHIGRLDPSKNIEKLIQTVITHKNSFPNAYITFYGENSSSETISYVEYVKNKYAKYIESGLVNFKGKINRSEIPQILRNYDIFIHNFQGSLDKTLIEATLVGIPVITINQEYLKQFEYWGPSIELKEQLDNLTSLERSVIIEKIENNYHKALKFHTLDQWITQLVDILEGKRN